MLEVATLVSTTVVSKLDSPNSDVESDAVVLSSVTFGDVVVPLSPLREANAAGQLDQLSLPGIANFLRSKNVPHWAFYVYGSLASFAKVTGWLPPVNARLSLAVTSDVPTAQGVSSSASVEVATMRSLAALSGIDVPQLRIAHAAQAAENYVVGAPCGLMDQLASACGAPGRVLPILCRPDVLFEPVPLPPGVALVGWPSGVKHNVGASPYMVARTASFMGKKIAETVLGRKLAYTAEITPYELATRVAPALPEAMTGAAFVAAHGTLDDALSRIDSELLYPIRAALSFPVEENFRCALAQSLLEAAGTLPRGSPQVATMLEQVGELMRLTHAGYTAMGLGCHETDEIVARLTAAGPSAGVYGARVSGGGSGGTVVVLCTEAALPTVESFARELTFGEPFTALIR